MVTPGVAPEGPTLPVASQPVTLPAGVMLRNFAPSDLPYLMSSWLRDLRDADPGPLPDDLFFAAQRGLIERLLVCPEVRCTIAAAEDVPDEILGYVVAIPKELLLWIHTRKGLRNRGIAKLLLTTAECPPGTPSTWSTALGKIRLRNPPRGRQVRTQPPFTLPRQADRPDRKRHGSTDNR